MSFGSIPGLLSVRVRARTRRANASTQGGVRPVTRRTTASGEDVGGVAAGTLEVVDPAGGGVVVARAGLLGVDTGQGGAHGGGHPLPVAAHEEAGAGGQQCTHAGPPL